MVGFKGEVTLKIGGKKRLLKFGTNQTAILCEMYDVPLEEMDQAFSPARMSVAQTRDLIYSAIAAGCLTKGKEIDFTQYQVGDWVDDLPQEDLERIFKAAYKKEVKAKKK